MTAADPELELIAELLRTSWPDRRYPMELHVDAELGDSGLGLDSVERFELLVACEERYRVPLTEKLLETDPLTVGRLIAHFAIR